MDLFGTQNPEEDKADKKQPVAQQADKKEISPNTDFSADQKEQAQTPDPSFENNDGIAVLKRQLPESDSPEASQAEVIPVKNSKKKTKTKPAEETTENKSGIDTPKVVAETPDEVESEKVFESFVKIISISGANYRNLRFDKVDLSKHPNGHVRALGKVGGGKSNFFEICRLALGGLKKITDTRINPDGTEKAGWEIKFSDSFYMGMTKTPTGKIDVTLYQKDKDDKKITPVKDGMAWTVSDYRLSLVTDLTFDTDKFLSEDDRIHWKYIEKIYYAVLKALGLVGDINDPTTFDYKINKAIEEREVIHRERSSIGAQQVNLDTEFGEKAEPPAKVDVALLNTKLTEQNTNKQNVINEIVAINRTRFEEYQTAKANSSIELSQKKATKQKEIDDEKLKLKSYNSNIETSHSLLVAKLKDEITTHNNEQDARQKKINDCADYETQFIDLMFNLNKIGFSSETILDAPITETYDQALLREIKEFHASLPKPIDGRDFEKEKAVLDKQTTKLPVEDAEILTLTPEILATFPKDFQKVLSVIKTKFGELGLLNASEVKQQPDLIYDVDKLIELETLPHFTTAEQGEVVVPLNIHILHEKETELLAIAKNINQLTKSIASADDINFIVHRFEVRDQFVEAEAKVQKLRAEKKLAFTKVNTGVKGFKILYDDIADEVNTFYDGNCFGMPIEDRLFKTYSHTQQRFIAMQVQLVELKKKKNPLNAMWLDELGMDQATSDLIAKFGEENGLLIFTAGTGDYTKEDLTSNEILIENGEVLFSEDF